MSPHPQAPPASNGPVTVPQVFLGASRDYMVALADGTAAGGRAGPAPGGAEVWLHLPPDLPDVASRERRQRCPAKTNEGEGT